MILQPSRDVDAARRRAERIRIKARNVTEQYADLRALVDEAERNEDHLTLGYQSWTAYVSDLFGEEPLRLPRDERIPMVQMLADKGMSTRAIASVVGVTHETVAQDIKSPVRNLTPAEPESMDEYRGRVLADAEINQRVVKLTDPQSVADPTPTKVVGLDGKTYTRPEPKETTKETTMTAAPSRLAIPQPPKHGGNRPKHAQVIGNVIVSAQGLCIVADEIQALDGSINSEEAASYASDLSRIIRSLKRVQQLLTKEV